MNRLSCITSSPRCSPRRPRAPGTSGLAPRWANPDILDLHVRGSKAIQDGVRSSGVRRRLVVGGAGSLEVAPGLQLVDTPGSPPPTSRGPSVPVRR